MPTPFRRLKFERDFAAFENNVVIKGYADDL